MEEIKTPVDIIKEAVETTLTPQAVQPTPPQAVNVDINAILNKASEVAEKKSEAVAKSMLKQEGLQDEEVIKQIIADFKSKQMTPEKELEIERNKNIEITKELETERQQKSALLKGIPLDTQDETEKEKVNACLTLAKSYVSDTVTFDVALDKALKVINFEKNIPEIPYTGGGATLVKTGMTKEDYKKLSYNEKLKLKEKNPVLYKELTGK